MKEEMQLEKNDDSSQSITASPPGHDSIHPSTDFSEKTLSENDPANDDPADHDPADNELVNTDPEQAQTPARIEVEPPPDGGYGWVCVICVFLVNTHTWGINSSYGIFLAHYLATNTFPGASDLDFAFIGGLSLSMAQFIAPVATITTRKWGTRTTLVIGIILQSAALLGASWSTEIWQLFLSQGVCFGFGMGMQFSATVGIIPQWFGRRRSLANGIGTAGSGIGGLVYSLASNAIIQRWGTGWAFRILAIASAAACGFSAIIIRDRNKAIGAVQIAFHVSLLKRPEFLLTLAWGCFSVMGYVVLLFSIPSYANTVGLTVSQGSILGAMFNLGGGLGRPVIGSKRKILNRRSSNGTSGGITKIRNYQQLNYVAEVQWGNDTMYMLLDTGSSDTWVLKNGYQCLDDTGAPTNQTNCSIAPLFKGNFTGGQIGNVNFNVSYGTGIVSGVFGWEDITIAGITVPEAQVAVVDKAYFPSYNVSGIFGLAFPKLTSEYPGSDPSQDGNYNYMNYEPVFYKMVDQQLSLPTFSFAPQRGGNNGYLAFGGIPPVNTTGKTAAVPILTTSTTGSTASINQGDYYTISVDGATYGSSKNGTLTTYNKPFQAIMDTGTSGLYLPNDLVTSLTSRFNPPAKYVSATGTYEVPCNATAPSLGFTIGGVNFNLTRADLISPLVDSTTGLCEVFLFSNGNSTNILGDSLLNNLLTTFDLGAMQLRITALT